MLTDNNWNKFIQTGSIEDYLKYVNSCKEQQIIGGDSNSFYNTRLGNKGNECGGK